MSTWTKMPCSIGSIAICNCCSCCLHLHPVGSLRPPRLPVWCEFARRVSFWASDRRESRSVAEWMVSGFPRGESEGASCAPLRSRAAGFWTTKAAKEGERRGGHRPKPQVQTRACRVWNGGFGRKGEERSGHSWPWPYCRSRYPSPYSSSRPSLPSSRLFPSGRCRVARYLPICRGASLGR